MTANAVTDDQKQKPSAEQVDTYTRRESELRTRFLKGILEIGGVLDGLQKLMEMTRGVINCNGQPEIPSWARQDDPIIQHILCGMIDPARLGTVSVFQDGEEELDGEEYIARAEKVEGAMNACASDFYAKPENWKYLPKDADIIVFPKTIFRNSDSDRYVRCLYRIGLEWHRGCSWLEHRFGRNYLVAVLAISPQVLDGKPS